MKSLQSSVPLVVQGWIVFLLLSIIAAVFLVPQAQSIFQNRDLITETELRTQKLSERLSKPATPDAFADYKAFIFELPAGITIERMGINLQSTLTQRVRASGARLRDLRKSDTNRLDLNSLERFIYHVEAEGDYIAITTVLAELSSMSEPFLLEEMTIQPITRGPSADRRLRLSVKLALIVRVSS